MRFLYLLILLMLPLYPLQAQEPASVQFIHNSLVADSIDVYVNGKKYADNLPYRYASSYMPVPSGSPVSIAVTVHNSPSVSEVLYHTEIVLSRAGNYSVIINSMLDSNGMDFLTGAGVYSVPQKMTEADVNIVTLNTSLRLPIVKLVSSGQVWIDALDAQTAEMQYLHVPVNNYTVELINKKTNDVYREYMLPLALLSAYNKPLLLLCADDAHPDAQPLITTELFVVLPAGGPLVSLPVNKAKKSVLQLQGQDIVLYPNPVTTTISFSGNIDFRMIGITIYDMAGKIRMKQLNIDAARLDVSTLEAGVYFLRMDTPDGRWATQQFFKQ